MPTEMNTGSDASLDEAIKSRYEANPDTNAYTDAEKAKVANTPADTSAALALKASAAALANYLALTGGALTGTLNANGNVTITNANPSVQLVDDDAPADQQKIRLSAQDDLLIVERFNDNDTLRETSARFDPSGASAPNAITVMTREKGDSRYPRSDPAGVTGADQVTNIISLTQAQYDAIGTKDAATLYYITDA